MTESVRQLSFDATTWHVRTVSACGAANYCTGDEVPAGRNCLSDPFRISGINESETRKVK